MLSFGDRLRAIYFDENNIPEEFLDPVHYTLMENPVSLSDGKIYDIKTALELIHSGVDSPHSRKPLQKWHTDTMVEKYAQIVTFVERQEALAKPFMDVIKQKNAEIEKLVKERDNLMTANADLKNEITSLHGKRRALENANQTLEQNLIRLNKQLEESNAASQALIRDLRAQLAASKQSRWNPLSYFSIFNASSATVDAPVVAVSNEENTKLPESKKRRKEKS